MTSILHHLAARGPERVVPAGGRRMATAALALALVVAACSGSPAPTSGVVSLDSPGATESPGASTAPTASDDYAEQLLAYSQCMRDHGIAGFPDLGISNGRVDRPSLEGTGIDPSSATFRAADAACQSVFPPSLLAAQQPMSAQDQAKWLQFSACIRTHGVPNFPDPDFTNGGPKPYFDYSGTGVDSQSPAVAAAMDACRSVLPVLGGASPSPGPTNQP